MEALVSAIRCRDSLTALLIEDDKQLLEVFAELLELAGYTLQVCSSVGDATQLCRGSDRTVDVLVTDMELPDGTGDEIARLARAQYPELRLLFVSGRPRDTFPALDLFSDSQLLHKPFKRHELYDALYHLLH
jgi:DNA-binding response OmpR family regulator